MELRVNRKISTQKSGTHYSPTVICKLKRDQNNDILLHQKREILEMPTHKA